MWLAIDVGNTNLVLGCFSDGKLIHTWRVSTHPASTPDEFRVKLRNLFQCDGIEFKTLQSVVISSVVPQVTATLRTAFSDARVFVIDHSWPFSFSICATPPEQVGADRLVNAEAAVRGYGSPCIIVDSGTATTICAVSAKREYLGGAIMPGIELSVETLARRTAKLFQVELVPPKRAIGHNTQNALQSGLLLGYAFMIDGMIRRFKEELNAPNAPVVATGGVSERLQGIAQELKIFEPDLTLKGIHYLYDAFTRQS